MTWPPRSIEALGALVSTVNVHETASLEVKRDLPSSKGKNADVAIDVCAMTVDGGVIIYGVDETAGGLELHPIDLTGARERVADITRASIAEPPEIEIIELPTGPEVGYLVVNVPESNRAPHMVQVKGSHRYYGRDSGGNRVLSEGEVARLYTRREHAAASAGALVDRLVDAAPLPPTPQTYGTLHLLVRPVIQHENFLAQAWGPADYGEASSRIFGLTQEAVRSTKFAEAWAPNLTAAAGGGTLLRNIDEWLIRRLEAPGYGSDLAISDSGSLRVWIEHGAADLRNHGQTFALRDGAIAQIVTHGLAMGARLLASGSYHGAVDAVVVLDGIGQAVSSLALGGGMYLLPGQRVLDLPDRYTRSARSTVVAIADDPKSIARRLVSPLLDTARQGGPDAFV